MNPQRRAWLMMLALPPGAGARDAAAAPAPPLPDATTAVQRGRVLAFARDHGAHPAAQTEWWYATGWLQAADPAAPLGFQVTFFRRRTGLADGNASRFAARHLLFAHAAVTDVAARRHAHASRMARWDGQDTPGRRAFAAVADADVALAGWRLRRSEAGYAATVDDDALALHLLLKPTQPLLLQGEAGFSRKGPEPRQASHYVSEPQLHASGQWRIAGRAVQAQGRAWLDHEWSDEVLHPQAVGWDWIGINLDDGSALTAFQLRRADGSVLWAGGSFRARGGAPRPFAPDEVRFTPGRAWRSPATHAHYPVQWQVRTPAGTFAVDALLDAQELDERASTGTVYWEGLSALRDARGQRVGLGYLEMTGYAGRLRL